MGYQNTRGSGHLRGAWFKSGCSFVVQVGMLVRYTDEGGCMRPLGPDVLVGQAGGTVRGVVDCVTFIGAGANRAPQYDQVGGAVPDHENAR